MRQPCRPVKLILLQAGCGFYGYFEKLEQKNKRKRIK